MHGIAILSFSLLLALLSASCSPKYIGKFYDGPDLPESEVGTVIFQSRGGWFNSESVVLCKIDGIRVDMNPDKRSVDVLPGMRTIMFVYDKIKPLSSIEWTFRIEPGHKYLVGFPDQQPGSGFILWLDDLTMGKRVNDVTASALKSFYACF